MAANGLDHYLGSFATDVAVNAYMAGLSWTRQVGHLYLNTTDSTMRTWDGVQWRIISTLGDPVNSYKSYSFTSNGVGSGTYFVGGYYSAPAARFAFTQAAPSVAYGSANISYAAHAFIVAGGAGTVPSGQVSLRVSGTSITDAGVRTAADTEIIVADITTLALNQYAESTKKWIGPVTFALVVVAGAPATYSLNANYGRAKYEDFNNTDFTVIAVEAVGLAGGNDATFNIQVLLHDGTGWVYSAAAFVPGGTVIAALRTDHGAESNLATGQRYAWKRDNLSQQVHGAESQGIIVRLTLGAPGSLQSLNFHLGVARGLV